MEKTDGMRDRETWCCQRAGALEIFEQQAKRTRGLAREEMSTVAVSAKYLGK